MRCDAGKRRDHAEGSKYRERTPTNGQHVEREEEDTERAVANRATRSTSQESSSGSMCRGDDQPRVDAREQNGDEPGEKQLCSSKTLQLTRASRKLVREEAGRKVVSGAHGCADMLSVRYASMEAKQNRWLHQSRRQVDQYTRDTVEKC